MRTAPAPKAASAPPVWWPTKIQVDAGAGQAGVDQPPAQDGDIVLGESTLSYKPHCTESAEEPFSHPDTQIKGLRVPATNVPTTSPERPFPFRGAAVLVSAASSASGR